MAYSKWMHAVSLASVLMLVGAAAPVHSNDAAAKAAIVSGHYEVAFKDYLAAASAGDPHAQFELGKLYEQGLGVLQNYVEAHRWYNLAAAGGIAAAAKARDALAAKMSPTQLTDARKLAAEWHPTTSETAPAKSAAQNTSTAGYAPAGSAAHEQDAIAKFKAGLEELRAGKPDAAITDLSSGLKIKPDPVAEFLLGEAYQQTRQPKLAEQAFQRSLKLDPKSPVAVQARQAEAEVTSTTSPAPTGAESASTTPAGKSPVAGTGGATAPEQAAAALFKTGLTSLRAGKPDDAITDFSAGLKLHQDALAEFFLGQAYQQKHEDGLAVQAYQASLAADPTSPVAPQVRKAVAALVGLLVLTPKLIANAQTMLNMLGYDAGPSDGNAGPKTTAAIKAFQKEQGLNADGQLSAPVIDLLSDRTAAKTKEADAHFRVGFEAAKAKKWSVAIREFRAGLALRPDAQAEFYLGEAYRVSGQDNSAITSYRASVNAAPDSPVAARARSEIAQLSDGTIQQVGAGANTNPEIDANTLARFKAAVNGYHWGEAHLHGNPVLNWNDFQKVGCLSSTSSVFIVTNSTIMQTAMGDTIRYTIVYAKSGKIFTRPGNNRISATYYVGTRPEWQHGPILTEVEDFNSNHQITQITTRFGRCP